MRKATNVARENLVSLGTCFGKMTKSGKFRLHITALDFLAPYAKVGTDSHIWKCFCSQASNYCYKVGMQCLLSV